MRPSVWRIVAAHLALSFHRQRLEAVSERPASA